MGRVQGRKKKRFATCTPSLSPQRNRPPAINHFSPSSTAGLRPSQRATTGVSATVGGKRTGDSALCAAYAIANAPTFSLVALTVRPTRASKAPTSTPAVTAA